MKALRALFLCGGLLTPAALAADVRPADMNCDGSVNFSDIDGFAVAIISEAGYLTAFPACNYRNADCNFDGLVNFDDINSFVAFVINGPVIPTELAGRALAAYPFFEFNTAIHNNVAIQAAVDPTRFPAAVGAGRRLYVVANRMSSAWAANPTLTDVRGAPQTVDIAAGTIQANTFTLAAAGALSSDAGRALGVGYDVVLDINANGLLDAGDLIDGRGDEGGFYYVRSTTTAGPLAVTGVSYAVTGVTAGFNNQRTYYPNNIAALEPLPLIVISHGNGHNFAWYDYLQSHLASYGYVVMSHANNTGPGPVSAALTTLEHTQAILAQQATIAGGVLNGRIDDSRIMWVGHSRGGEGVVLAYDRLFDGSFTSPQYSIGDIVVISSIAPTDFQGLLSAAPQGDPHDVNYHLIYGSSDGDVMGAPGTGSKPFAMYERATGTKQVTYLQGVGHNEFNCCGANDATGPDLIGRPAAQTIARGYFLPLAQHYLDGNIPSRDFFTRMYANFKPQGVLPAAILATEYRDALTAPLGRVDDYQTQTATGTSSSGGAVTFTVGNVVEAVMIDTDGSFDFSAAVPMNGMTRGKNGGDSARGVVFDWTTPTFYELSLTAALRNLRSREFLSLRACQGTRHPNTDALNAPLTFTVTLRDADGTTSSINIGNYGGITRTYRRDGSGSGFGWANEFNTVRIRMTDFLTNGSGLDLGNVTAIRLSFGAGAGSNLGRMGLDDVELTLD